MQALFRRLFARYGTAIGVGEDTVFGIFFSVNSRSWQNMERFRGPLGEIPRGQYIAVLPAGVNSKAGDVLKVDETFYEIRRSERVRAMGKTMYHWCLCVERGGDDLW